MRFAPKPPNDFHEFIRLYYEQCRGRVPAIAAIAGKWSFEDLLPGLSDFDTRFIVQDGMSVQDWCDMSTAVGEVHLSICKRFPHWARNLEHLPGINLTWDELTDPAIYYPEYPQWTFYETTDPQRLHAAQRYLAARPWDRWDEYFHLRKFCSFYGRYDRAIDPPVNLGAFENKYALHSRFMHYFCPPLQSALCIILKRPVRGKAETIRLACEMFSDTVFKEMIDAVEAHYEIPALYEEPELTRLEDRLEAALAMLAGELAPRLTIVPDPVDKTVAQWKRRLDAVPLSPVMRIFDSARFSRLMKGRLQFYGNAPPHFDSVWLIENELRRIRRNFFEIPFGVFWEVTTGQRPHNAVEIIPKLCPTVLTREEAHYVAEFVRLLPGRWESGCQKAIALALSGIFDGFLSALSKIVGRVKEMSGENR